MNHGRRVWPAILALGLLPSIAAADDARALPEHATLSLDWQPTDDQPAATARSHVFGDEGSQWWTIGGGAAYDFTASTDTNIRFAYSYFLIKDVEFSLELNGWYFNQPGDNAFGINPAINFRWHFIDKDPWTLYADVGIGVLAATDNVPAGGTSFDFTPKAGMGFTRRLGDSDARLQVGVRWHHVSNGRIFGTESNPARDGLMLYTGIQWPF
jgi:hypothetical protein